MSRLFAAAPWVLLILAVADLAALKTGTVSHPHEILAILFALAALAFLVRIGFLGVEMVRNRSRRIRRIAEAAILLGVLFVLGGGFANWLLSLQGYVILHEGEKSHLYDGGGLERFVQGPLADLEEMEISLGLIEVELVSGGGGMFSPRSRIYVYRHDLGAEELVISPGVFGRSGPLRFHQGAFGFSPRLVVLRQGATGDPLYDEVVPFVTSRQGPTGLTFRGEAELDDGLAVHGFIDLDSLDEGLRGHATLRLTVELDGRRLGEGALLPGRFADVDEGYRIGFAGLEKWSEVVVSRRNYTPFMLAGAVLAVAAGLLLPLILWRGW